MKKLSLYPLFLCITLNLLSMENQLTPLHKAVLDNNLEAVKMLIKEGADCEEKDSHGKTAFYYAAKSKARKKIAAYLYPRYYDLEYLQNIIGYKFKKVAKIIKAFTTRKFCKERNYEIYEWFGDAILHEVLTVILDDQSYENANEGKLTDAREILEQKETLAALSKKLGFDRYIIKDAKDRITIDMLEDIVESLIAAIYKDGGAIPAQNFIQRYWMPMLKNSKKAPSSPVKLLESLKDRGCKEHKNITPNLTRIRLIYGNLVTIGNCSRNECKLEKTECETKKKMERIARYRAASKFIEALPHEFDEFKEMILISPLSDDYQIDSNEIKYSLDTNRWESNLPSNFSYKIHMISQMLNGNDKEKAPEFVTPNSGKDHEPIFTSTLSCAWLKEQLTGEPARTKKAAEENVAKLAYELWRRESLGSDSNSTIDPRKLAFLQLIKEQLNTNGGRNTQQLLNELTQKLDKNNPDYTDYLIGGKVGNPQVGHYYSTVTCYDITNEVITGEKCTSVLKARKSAASIMLDLIMKELTKTK